MTLHDLVAGVRPVSADARAQAEHRQGLLAKPPGRRRRAGRPWAGPAVGARAAARRGVGALLALPLVQAAAAVLRDTGLISDLG